MKVLFWILNNKRWSLIIVLFLYGFWQTWQSNHLTSELDKSKADCVAKVEKAVKPYKEAISKAEIDKANTEKQWVEKLLESERNAIQKIKTANDDATHAHNSANSLSKQLAEAKRKLSSASKETQLEYTNQLSDVFEDCTAEYREMAKHADAERIDKERLSEFVEAL